MKKSDLVLAVSHLQEACDRLEPKASPFFARVYATLLNVRWDLMDYVYSHYDETVNSPSDEC